MLYICLLFIQLMIRMANLLLLSVDSNGVSEMSYCQTSIRQTLKVHYFKEVNDVKSNINWHRQSFVIELIEHCADRWYVKYLLGHAVKKPLCVLITSLKLINTLLQDHIIRSE